MNLYDVLLGEFQVLFEARDTINGKVDLQKSFYLMKELGFTVPFKFRWNRLGPYSLELDNFADRLIAEGYVKYTGSYVKNEEAFKGIQPRDNEKLDKFFGSLERICSDNDFDKVVFIECVASLHFLYKYSQIRTKEEVFKRLKELKPERDASFKPLRDEAWSFLRNQDLIR